MKPDRQRFLIFLHVILTLAVCFSTGRFALAAQAETLQLDPARTTVNFTLSDVLHTVRGTFHLKQGALSFDPVSGKLSGQIVVDARSGESGNGMRDRKMHREVLESERYPEIIFRPDHVEGSVTSQGRSDVRVHGIFTIHGADHEISVPAQVQMAPGYWTASLHFEVPYAAWGMKNPSTLFLKVGETVAIDITSSGAVTPP